MGIGQLKMLGDGPYPLPVKQFFERVNTFVNQDLCIIAPKAYLDFPKKDFHVHDSYEFLVPYSTMPYVDVDNRCFSINKGYIFPINTGQAHGPHDRMINQCFISLQVDNDSLNEIAYSVYRKFNVRFKQDNYSLSNELKKLIDLFIEECRSIHSGRNLILKDLSTQILSLLIKQIPNNMSFIVPSDYNTDKKNLYKVIEYLRDQYDANYSLEEAAQIAHLSPYHFIRTFKAYTGKSPYEYLMLVKLNKAKELLSSNKSSITEVCYTCGFNNLSNFINCFKKKVGVTPSEYRKIMNV
ncbi:MAG TPA: helix-turn-helix transcriptional regulator [Clostridiaceae bacterium]|nr:helix-turn-helix transcriptional regulator [Clostridiaceae bacterium]